MSSEDIKPGFKRTEVGVIPEEWGVKRLGELTQDTKKIRYGIVQPGKFNSGGCFMLRSQDYSKGWVGTDGMHQLTSELEQQFKNAKLRANDLVMTVVGAGIGQVVIIPDWLDGSVPSRSTARIAIDAKKAEFSFVKDLLESPVGRRQLIDCQKEGAQPVVSCPDLAKFFIPLPTLQEQRAIATALSDVDALLTKLDQLIAKKRDLKQATMQQLLTGQTRLPGFSGAWEVKRLGDVCRISTGKKDVNEGNPAGQYPFFTCARANTYSDSYSFEGEAILIAGNGEVGNLNYYNGKFEAYQRTYVLQGFSIEARYLWHQLSAYLVFSLGIGAIGSSIPYIKKENLVGFEFQSPVDETEQAAIATVLSDMDAELATLEARRDKTRALKQGMMQELLTGRIRLTTPEISN